MSVKMHGVKWGPTGNRMRAAGDYWKRPLKWNAEAKRDGVRRRVFCASLADVFEEWNCPIIDHKGRELWISPQEPGRYVPNLSTPLPPGSRGELTVQEHDNLVRGVFRLATLEDLRADLFALIDATPNLDWLLLTKRPQNVLRMWPEPKARVWSWSSVSGLCLPLMNRPNVWLGVSISEQTTADEMIPALLRLQDLSPVPFLSIEPVLGPIDLRFFDCWISEDHYELRERLGWVIVGGESGPDARPVHPAWIRKLRDECRAAEIPFFFKQWGEWSPDQPRDVSYRDARIDRVGRDITMLPQLWSDQDQVMYRVGKKLAGRMLDGVLWHQFPITVKVHQ
jgi:protein gp37